MNAEARLRPEHAVAGRTAPASAALAGALILGVVAAYSPKTALEALLALALVVVAVWRLDLAVAVFVVLTFPEHLPGAFGEGVTLAKPVGAVIALAWLAIVASRRGAVPILPRDCPALFWAAVGFLALGTTSVLWATGGSETIYVLGRLAQVALLAVIAYTAAGTRSGFRTILWGYLAGSAITSLYSIATGAYGQNGRLGTLFDPNYFAAILVPAICVALFLAVGEGDRRSRTIAAGVALVDLAAFVLTQSRGGLVGLGVGLAAAVVLAGRARPRVLALVLVLVAGGLGYYAVAAPAHVLSGSSSGRAGEWRVAIRMFEHHPVGGVGLGNFTVVEPSYATETVDLNRVGLIVNQPHRTHNTYLEVLAELGVPGLLLFLAVIYTATRAALGGLARLTLAEDPLELPARGLIAGAIGLFSAYIFISATWEKQLWLIFGLLGAIAVLVRERDEPESS